VIWKPQKKESNRNRKHSERPLQQTTTSGRISEPKDKIEIKGKTELLVKQLKTLKGMYKNSPTSSKDQT
jgi:hypothetical protein